MNRKISLFALFVVLLGIFVTPARGRFYKKRILCESIAASSIVNEDDYRLNQKDNGSFKAEIPDYCRLNEVYEDNSHSSIYGEAGEVSKSHRHADVETFEDTKCHGFADDAREITDCNEEACATQRISKREIFDLITPELIEFFEKSFIKANIITNLKPQKVEKMTNTYQVSEKKLFALLALQYICKKNNKKMTLQHLSKLSTVELIEIGREQGTIYYNNLSEEEKQQILADFDKLKQGGTVPII